MHFTSTSPLASQYVVAETAAAMPSPEDNNMQLGLTRPLREAVQQKFVEARKSGDLLFSDTQLSILRSRSNAPVSG